ncbi:MAG TPA: CAP domain-containing protein [Candidatus Saccharimonadales bacterium]|nr:CAP domain-containing protein [Candidatus Saccharimonadales bacterium]
MKDFFKHYFLPHHTNNQRPKLLHHDSLFILAVVILSATLFVTNIRHTHPSVLGDSINIATQDLLNLTNQERQKNGFSPLVMNDQLTNAAKMKAQDMFALNYWAHNSPTGTMPWDFIKKAGYDYEFAGENLARGFTSAPDVVTAWMNSPSHRENMLSPHYKDVGFALQEGSLTGEKDTILIVEELGSTPINTPQVDANKTLGTASTAPSVAIKNNPMIDTRSLTKTIALGILSLFILIFLVDLMIIKRKKIVRFVGHNLDHIMFLATIGVVILMLHLGVIL